MKARVKATGDIVDIAEYSTIYAENFDTCFYPNELEILDTSDDYWARLEHQYAGMAMQGMMNNSYLAGEFRKDPNNGIEDMSKIITKAAAVYAHALVEKYKEKEANNGNENTKEI